MPLLVTNLSDEVEANVEAGRTLWVEVGRQWLAEEGKRDKRVKDMVEFPSDPPAHYPGGGKVILRILL